MVRFDFSGKVALVTGGTSGIGRAAAVAFGRAGARVAISGRRQSEGEKTALLVEQAGGEAAFFRSSVDHPDEVAALVEGVVERFGRLDVAFNNAGIEGTVAPLHEQSDEAFASVTATNVGGVFTCMKHEIAAMLRSGGGAIVNNSSIAGEVGFPGASVYAASKHAVIGLTRAAALEYGKQGIRINAVLPGPIVTDMLQRFSSTVWPDAAERDAAMAGMTPMGRLATVDEVAAPVLFLCSDAAAYITGALLPVDGGYVAG